jgi:hypothetical protein
MLNVISMSLAVTLGVVSSVVPIAAAAEGRGCLADKGGKVALAHILSMTEEQGGVAGRNVTLWEIKPTGAWSMVRFLRDEKGQPAEGSRKEVASGTLSADDLTSLAKVLSDQRIDTLPARLGVDERVNPHLFTLKCGERSSTAWLAFPQEDSVTEELFLRGAPKDESQRQALKRFATMANTISTKCR